MRRLVKENLVKFDGTKLFPERFAYTVQYNLSELEFELYNKVTDYVRDEMNRADRLLAAGDKIHGNRVGFALTILQRRLASSPEAIYRSLMRRRDRLETRLKKERIDYKKDSRLHLDFIADARALYDDDYDSIYSIEYDEDKTGEERENIETALVEQASAARTIPELETEIQTLVRLENLADMVRKSGTDKKWEELSKFLQETNELFDNQGRRKKIIIFSEHRDTIHYLLDKIRGLFGSHDAAVTIHGGVDRQERLDEIGE
jgi:hypothetical protein